MLRKPKKFNPRNTDEYKQFCYQVRKRDRHKCQMPDCGATKNTQVHHIRRWADSGSGKLDQHNAVLLCEYHHKQVTGNENLYAQLLLKIVSENILNYKDK